MTPSLAIQPALPPVTSSGPASCSGSRLARSQVKRWNQDIKMTLHTHTHSKHEAGNCSRTFQAISGQARSQFLADREAYPTGHPRGVQAERPQGNACVARAVVLIAHARQRWAQRWEGGQGRQELSGLPRGSSSLQENSSVSVSLPYPSPRPCCAIHIHL